MLEKTLENPLNCKKIQPVHPKGDQSWLFIGKSDVEAETPVLWPPDLKLVALVMHGANMGSAKRSSHLGSNGRGTALLKKNSTMAQILVVE